MCTEHDAHEVTVCDVAMADVREALAGIPQVSFTPVPFQGTRVTSNHPGSLQQFRARLSAALARHGGALPGPVPGLPPAAAD